jgi:S1-C subfamily serine protease
MSYTQSMLPLSELSRLATVLGGVPIPGCLEGSPAARAGIRYGDVVLSINGVPTASWTDFFQARRRRNSHVVTARVFRQGTEFEVTLELPAQTRSPRHVLEQTQRRSAPALAADSSEPSA